MERQPGSFRVARSSAGALSHLVRVARLVSLVPIVALAPVIGLSACKEAPSNDGAAATAPPAAPPPPAASAAPQAPAAAAPSQPSQPDPAADPAADLGRTARANLAAPVSSGSRSHGARTSAHVTAPPPVAAASASAAPAVPAPPAAAPPPVVADAPRVGKPKPDTADPFEGFTRGTRPSKPMKDEDPFAAPAAKKMNDDNPFGGGS